MSCSTQGDCLPKFKMHVCIQSILNRASQWRLGVNSLIKKDVCLTPSHSWRWDRVHPNKKTDCSWMIFLFYAMLAIIIIIVHPSTIERWGLRAGNSKEFNLSMVSYTGYGFWHPEDSSRACQVFWVFCGALGWGQWNFENLTILNSPRNAPILSMVKSLPGALFH